MSRHRFIGWLVASILFILFFLVGVLIGAMGIDAKADTYTFTNSVYTFSSPTLACRDVGAAFAEVKNIQSQYGASYRAYSPAGCGAQHDGIVGHTSTLQTYNATGPQVDTVTITLTAIVTETVQPPAAVADITPDLARRVSSYPVGEVVVMCAAFLLCALGFRSGQAQ